MKEIEVYLSIIFGGTGNNMNWIILKFAPSAR